MLYDLVDPKLYFLLTPISMKLAREANNLGSADPLQYIKEVEFLLVNFSLKPYT